MQNEENHLWYTGLPEWARPFGPALGKHAYFGGLFSMDEDIDGASFAVFDDFGGIKFLPSYKFWLGTRANSTSRTNTRERSWYTGLGLNLAI